MFVSSAEAMTASFSTGLSEHVEYTIRPVLFSMFIARWRMRSCSLRRVSTHLCEKESDIRVQTVTVHR